MVVEYYAVLRFTFAPNNCEDSRIQRSLPRIRPVDHSFHQSLSLQSQSQKRPIPTPTPQPTPPRPLNPSKIRRTRTIHDRIPPGLQMPRHRLRRDPTRTQPQP